MIRPVKDHPCYLCSSEEGLIIGKRGRRLRGTLDRCGYVEVSLSENGKSKRYLAHRLILSTFKPCENMDELDVNHINGDKTDNRLSNLEWCTRSENIKHSYRNGLQKVVTNPKGTYRVLSVDDINTIVDLHRKGLLDREIATKLNCSRSLVSRKIRELKLR